MTDVHTKEEQKEIVTEAEIRNKETINEREEKENDQVKQEEPPNMTDTPTPQNKEDQWGGVPTWTNDEQRKFSRPNGGNDNFKRRRIDDEQEPEPSKSLAIFGIPRDMDLVGLQEFLNKHTPDISYENCNIAKDKNTGESRGFAFVNFNCVEKATQAKDILKDQPMFDMEGVQKNFRITYSIQKPRIFNNREGSSRDGFNREDRGFGRSPRKFNDRENGNEDRGFGREGFSREGRGGFNREDRGFNKEDRGSGRDGFNRESSSREGFGREGSSRDGFNRDGFNREDRGFSRSPRKFNDRENGNEDRGFGREGFNKEDRGFKREDRNNYSREGSSREGFNREDRNNDREQRGFNREPRRYNDRENETEERGFSRDRGFNNRGGRFNRDDQQDTGFKPRSDKNDSWGNEKKDKSNSGWG